MSYLTDYSKDFNEAKALYEQEDNARELVNNAIIRLMRMIRDYDFSYHFNYEINPGTETSKCTIKECMVSSYYGKILEMCFVDSTGSIPGYYYLHTVVIDRNMSFDNDVKSCFFLTPYYLDETLDKLFNEFIKPKLEKSKEIQLKKEQAEYERKMRLLNPEAWATLAATISWMFCKFILKV